MDRVGESFGFECASCGEYHAGMPSFGWEWPLPYLFVPEAERPYRVELGADSCVIDEKEFYVRGCLEIPVHQHEEPFSWGAWVSLSRDNFVRYTGLHDNIEREPGPRFVGWLSSAIPGYPAEEPLRAALRIRPWPTRPLIELEPTEHPLAVAQRDGITPARVQEIAQRVMHPAREP